MPSNTRAAIQADEVRYRRFLRGLVEQQHEGRPKLWLNQRRQELMSVDPEDGRLYNVPDEIFRCICNDMLQWQELPPGCEAWKLFSIPEGHATRQTLMDLIWQGRFPQLAVNDPVLDAAQAVEWDGEKRLEKCPWRLVDDELGIGPHILRKLVIEPILRARDHRKTTAAMLESLLLYDPVGGMGKSLICKELWGNDWYLPVTSGFHAMSEYDRIANWAGKAIIELPEMAILESISEEQLKPLLDHVPLVGRVPGTAHTVTRPRLFSIVGTTNKQRCIPDAGGLRRWLPVSIEGFDENVIGGSDGEAFHRWLIDNRLQLLAEGYHEIEATGASDDVDAIDKLLPAFWSRDPVQFTQHVRQFTRPTKAAAAQAKADERERERAEQAADLGMLAEEVLGMVTDVGITAGLAMSLMPQLKRPQDVGMALRAIGWKRERLRRVGQRLKFWRGPDWDGERVLSTWSQWEAACKSAAARMDRGVDDGDGNGDGGENSGGSGKPDGNRDPDGSGGVNRDGDGSKGDGGTLHKAAMGEPEEYLRERGFVGCAGSEDRKLARMLQMPVVVAGEKIKRPGRIYWRVNQLRAGVQGHCATDRDVTHLTACFADWDDIPIPAQWQLIEDMPLPPTAVVWTGNKSLHPYWVLDHAIPLNDASWAVWRSVQEGLIRYWGGDHTIKNPSRMMAYPWRPHSNGRVPLLWLPEEAKRYELADLELAFGLRGQDKKAAEPVACATVGPPPRLCGGQAEALRVFREVMQRGMPTGGDGTGTFGAQRGLVWGGLEWAAEQGLPAKATHPIILGVLAGDRPRDAARLLESWQRGKHKAGVFIMTARRLGLLPP